MNAIELEELLKSSDNKKSKILHDQDFIEKNKLDSYDLKNIILSMSDETRIQILSEVDLINQHFSNSQITDLIESLPGDDTKREAMRNYSLVSYLQTKIIGSFSDKSKLDVLLESNEFNKFDITGILESMSVTGIAQFLKDHKDYLTKNNICPYEIIKNLDSDSQKEFLSQLEDIESLTLNEKREILAILDPGVKESIDTSDWPEEYKKAISVNTNERNGRVILDYERALEDYEGLDNLIRVYPEQFTEEQRSKFMRLCDICPDAKVVSTLNESVEYVSKASEYKKAEEWIKSVLDSIPNEYSKAQKLAVIDHAIGSKISYSPEYGTEVSDMEGPRALWKIISSGYGVCNGIAKVENYILSRVGIESEIIGGIRHTFLKVKDLEVTLASGETVTGNTILDPTWNLCEHRFGARPDNFCISYEQARKNDIDDEGKDHECHKNDEELQDATLSLDEQSLRQLFRSVGLAEKDGQFPIKHLIEESASIDKANANNPNQNIQEQLELLERVCPEFANCQNSSIRILSDILLAGENLKFDRCAVDRVYNRSDEDKSAVMYIYIDLGELGQKFYVANKSQGQFLEMSQEDFTKQFECYEEDMKKHGRNKTMGI